jgi:hypothetical protein
VLAWCRIVRRLVSWTSLLLLALWLPATLHCDLEAAGLHHLWGCHDEAASETGHNHSSDHEFHPVEDGAFNPATPFLRAAPPLTLSLGTVMADVFGTAARPPAAIEYPRIRPPPGLSAAWQFIERAAPTARAPSVHV